MAPREKRRKVGLMRMDAALDAMRSIGFSDNIIHKSVKDLLKVYGGEAGWPFIEEAAYKLLIDTILEAEEKQQVEIVQQSDEQEDSVPEINDKEVCVVQGCVQDISEQQMYVQKRICEQEKIQEEKFEAENCLSLKDTKLGVEVHHAPSCSQPILQAKLGPEVHHAPDLSPLSLDCLKTTRRRKPCYGWISDDDADD